MDLNNVNAYTEANTKELIKTFDDDIANYEQFIIDEIKKHKDNGYRLIHFPCSNDKLCNSLVDSQSDKYEGLDTRRRLLDLAKEKQPKYNYRLVSFANRKFRVRDESVLFNTNFLNRVKDPIEFIKKSLEKINAKKVFMSIHFDNEIGKDLGAIDVIRLDNGSRFIYTIYSKKAVEKIAKEFDLAIKEFNHNEDNFAVLYTKDKPAKKTIKKNKEGK